MSKTAIFILSFFCSPVFAQGSNIHLRAREHYEDVFIKNLAGHSSAHYAGFTNTLNLWHEVPFHYSLGLAGGPIFATLPILGSNRKNLPDRIRLLHYGIEGKFFPVPDQFRGFFRAGGFYTNLATRDARGDFHGTSMLLGLGYEWDWDGIGIAPEIDWRFGRLSDGMSFLSLGPAIGIHFYKHI